MALGNSKLVFLIIIIKNEYLQEIGLRAIWLKHIPKGSPKALGEGRRLLLSASAWNYL